MRDSPLPAWTFDSPAVRRLPYGARRRVAGSVGVLGLMAMALGLIGLGTTLALMVLPWLLEPLLDRLTRSRPGLLRVRDGRLWLSWALAPQPARAVALGGVSVGWCEPVADGVRVRLCLRSGDHLEVHTPDRLSGNALLDALGVGVMHRALAVTTSRPWLRALSFVVAFGLGVVAVVLGIASMATLFVSPWVSLALVLPLGAAGAGCLVLLRPVEALEVIVGADGVAVRGELRERYVPYGRVQAVCADASGVALLLRDGTVVRLLGRRCNARRRARLVLRLQDALAAYRATSPCPTVPGLARGEGSYGQWVASLRTLVVQEGVYRASPLQRGDFLRLLGDPHAEAPSRVAAALALSDALGSLPAEARGRVRIAADSTANDALRVALERALDGEFDERSHDRLQRVLAVQRV